MIGWIILGSVVVVLIILLFVVRIGFIFKYDRVEGFEVTLKVAFIKILIYSSKRRKDAEEAAVEKPPRDKEEKEAGKEEGGFFERIKDIYELIRGSIRRLGRAARVDLLRIRFVAAAKDDAAKAAIMYGQAWAVEGIIIGILENKIKVRKKDISIDVDYIAESPEFSFLIQLTAAMAGSLRAAIGLLFDIISIRRSKPKTLHEKGGA